MTICTIGHSTHPIGEFVGMLRAHGIGRLMDVRTVPRSAHNPQFESAALAAALKTAAIAYRHLPALGGLRRARRETTNTGWRNAAFRGYADYMQTPAFAAGLAELLALAAKPKRKSAPYTVIMCAEAVPWRCHRSLIADALLARGVEVRHIMSATAAPEARLTPFARVEGERVNYPAPE